MTTVALCPTAGILYQAFTAGGIPLNAGLLYTYGAGGTTPKATYTTSAGNVQNANPIVLGADGRPPNEIWLIASDAYRFDIKDSLGNLIASYDNISGIVGSSNLVGSTGAGLVGFSQSASYADDTVGSKLQQVVSVKDAPYNAAGDGVTDDTTAIQAAIDAVANADVLLYFPHGTYLLSSAITVSGAVRVEGAGRYATAITWTDTTQNVFVCSTPNQVTFERITFNAPNSQSAGSVISLTSGSGENTYSIFRDLTFNNVYNGILTIKAAHWTIDNCTFINYINQAITVQNTNNVDHGDANIQRCTINTNQANGVGILQVSSGGLRVNNNKFVGGLYGYRMTLASGAATSDLLIECNSLEAHTTASISMGTDGGGATFSQVVIVGNQFALTPAAINLNDSTAFLSRLNITGNTIALNASASAGITLTNTSMFYIGNNLITGGGGTPVGVTIGSSSSFGMVGPNRYHSLTTNLANASTSTYVESCIILAQSAVQALCGADTSEDTLATITVPANALRKNGRLRVTLLWSMTNNGNNKTLRVRFSGASGTIYGTVVLTATDSYRQQVMIANRNDTASQVGNDGTTGGWSSGGAVVTSSVDTTAATTIIITGQKASSGDSLGLESYLVELFQQD